MAKYPSNSFKSRETEETKDRKPLAKVTKGEARVRKKSASKKFLSNFIEEDSVTVKETLLKDVFVPTIKDLLLSLITGGMKMFLYGDTDAASYRGRRERYGSSHTPYYSYHDRRRDRDAEREMPRRRAGFEYDDILLDDLDEAEEVLSRMEDLIATYGIVSVLDYYELCGYEPKITSTCSNFGWTSLKNAQPTRLNTGEYVIRFPRALPID